MFHDVPRNRMFLASNALVKSKVLFVRVFKVMHLFLNIFLTSDY